MKKVPTIRPSAELRIAHPMLSPRAGPVKPSAIVKKLQFAMKNSGLTRHAPPPRSAGVIQSMDRDSMAEKRCGSVGMAAGGMVADPVGGAISVDTEVNDHAANPGRLVIASS